MKAVGMDMYKHSMLMMINVDVFLMYVDVYIDGPAS